GTLCAQPSHAAEVRRRTVGRQTGRLAQSVPNVQHL
ncbi:MAG: hypothetical protein AVDCRST_MAG93-5062, partial [uncultured Chloroflexia bacterium]